MNRHLHNILEGVVGLWPVPRDYIHPTGGGFARDAERLRGDFSALSKDLRTALKKQASKSHEQTQADSRQVR